MQFIFLTVLALLLLYMLAHLVQPTKADYVVEIVVRSFQEDAVDPDISGDGCSCDLPDFGETTGGCECEELVFCLRGVQVTEERGRDNQEHDCPLGRYETDTIYPVPTQLSFSGDVWPSSFQLYITRSPNVNIHVQLSLSPSRSYTPAAWYTGSGGKILLSFRVQCKPDFCGRNCSVYCVDTDIHGVGHYTCDASGQKHCLSGWMDPSNNCLNTYAEDVEGHLGSATMTELLNGALAAAAAAVILFILFQLDAPTNDETDSSGTERSFFIDETDSSGTPSKVSPDQETPTKPPDSPDEETQQTEVPDTLRIPPSNASYVLPERQESCDSTTSLSKSRIDWLEGLCEEELPCIQELGLGRAIDATLSQSWLNKRAYQAKTFPSKSDLVVTNEGSKVKMMSEQIENYYEMQAQVAAGIEIPNQPIEISIAAESHRSFGTSYSLTATTITTRTVTFNVWHHNDGKCMETSGVVESEAKPPSEYKSKFEMDLQRWVKENKRSDQDVQRCCLGFLKALGGATHYVSSITLGAMRYHLKRKEFSRTKFAQESHIKVPKLLNSKASGSWMSRSSRSKAVYQQIGLVSFDENEKLQPKSIEFRTPSEAVIQYAFTPLTNLVSDPVLQYNLRLAIRQYLTSFKKRGPYMVVSAEKVQVRASVKEHVYWTVEATPTAGKDRYQIVGTTTASNASTFYIRPDITSKSGQWFYITTGDGNDVSSIMQTGMMADDKSESEQAGSGKEETTSTTGEEGEDFPDCGIGGGPRVPETRPDGKGGICFERYIHVEESIFGRSQTLEAHCTTDKKKARFRLLDRLHHTAVPLTSSSWIPPMTLNDDVLFGNPYLLQPHCCSLWRSRRSLALHVGSGKGASLEGDRVQPFEFKSHSNEPKLHEHVMLFYLQKKTNK